MKKLLLSLINWLLDRNETTISDLETIEDKKEETSVNVQEKEKQSENDDQNKSSEVYEMLSLKERQTYLKKLGLYTKKIDGIVGAGTKRAIKQFNIIFLKKNTNTYYEDTDRLLRIMYKSYCESPFMKESDWQYFKNFKKNEYYCGCNKKYCDGYNGLEDKLPIRLVMADQYIRSYFNKTVKLSSTIRCKQKNKQVGGVAHSRHMEFKASDLRCSDIKAERVRQVIYVNSDTKLPFIRYAYNINTNYEHLDVKY